MTEMLSSSRLRTPPRDQICFAPRGPASLGTPPEGPTFLTMLDPDMRHDARSSHGCKRKVIPRVSTMAHDSIHSDESARKLINKPLGQRQGPRLPRETNIQPTGPSVDMTDSPAEPRGRSQRLKAQRHRVIVSCKQTCRKSNPGKRRS